jgi:hypothetical protein
VLEEVGHHRMPSQPLRPQLLHALEGAGELGVSLPQGCPVILLGRAGRLGSDSLGSGKNT